MNVTTTYTVYSFPVQIIHKPDDLMKDYVLMSLTALFNCKKQCKSRFFKTLF